jgi:hypothetical protein
MSPHRFPLAEREGKVGEAALARFVAETDAYFQPKKSFA